MLFLRGLGYLGMCVILISHVHIHLQAQPEFHGAASVYYSYSIDKPPDHQRAYSTQPARNAEVALDLAVLFASWKTSMVDLDVALQKGTWADVNYVGADAAWKVIHQASLRFKPDSAWSIGAGIAPSHIGQEGAINAKNLLLSRSLIADHTPYYNASVDVTWLPTPEWKVGLYILNGWQQIVDVNDQPSVGTKLEWSPTVNTTYSWNTYLGNDEPTGEPARPRIHSNMYADHRFSEEVRGILLFDVGLKKRAQSATFDPAFYLGVKSGWQVTSLVRLGARVEVMQDPERILVMSAPYKFQVIGASLGADLLITPFALVRFEARGLRATSSVFPSTSGLRRSDLFFTFGLSSYL